MLDCSDRCLTISEDPWPPSCTCLMYAQLWSMPALSGMAPYVKRMPFSSRGSRLQSPVASSKLRGTHPKAKYSKLSTGHSLRWRREIASLCLLHRFLNLQQEPLTNCLPPLASSRNPRSQRKPRQLILPAARSGVRSTPFRMVSASEVSPIQLGVWGAL